MLKKLTLMMAMLVIGVSSFAQTVTFRDTLTSTHPVKTYNKMLSDYRYITVTVIKADTFSVAPDTIKCFNQITNKDSSQISARALLGYTDQSVIVSTPTTQDYMLMHPNIRWLKFFLSNAVLTNRKVIIEITATR